MSLRIMKPKSWAEYHGNHSQVKDFKATIKKKVILLHGPPGCGKTSLVKLYALLNGYKLHEINASIDRTAEKLELIQALSRSQTLFPVIILLDEIDGIDWKKERRTMFKLIKNTKHPMVLIANNPRVLTDPKTTKLLHQIRFYAPALPDVINRMKQLADKQKILGAHVDYSSITQDYRQAFQTVFNDSRSRTPVITPFQKLEQIFAGQKPEQINLQKDAIWIHENISRFYFGYDLIKAHRLLAQAIELDEPRMLGLFPVSRAQGRFVKPLYWAKKKEIQRAEDKDKPKKEMIKPIIRKKKR